MSYMCPSNLQAPPKKTVSHVQMTLRFAIVAAAAACAQGNSVHHSMMRNPSLPILGIALHLGGWIAVDATKYAVNYDGAIESTDELKGTGARVAAAASLLRHEEADTTTTTTVTTLSPVQFNYGQGACQCVGFHNFTGTLRADGVMSASGQGSTAFSNGTGSYCAAWDLDTHPQCKSMAPPEWCTMKWCYVDPCACTLAKKVGSYLPAARWQGKGLEYSYVTCGNEDKYTSSNHASVCIQISSKASCDQMLHCSWSTADNRCNTKSYEANCKAHLMPAVYGKKKCRCIGTFGLPGSTMTVQMSGKSVTVNADSFTTCQAWDALYSPSCEYSKGSIQGGIPVGTGTTPPVHCQMRWCVVDPCCCDAAEAIEVMPYTPTIYYQGKPLYRSYDTCGNEYNTSACYAQKTIDGCTKTHGKDCAWTPGGCLPKGVTDDPTCASKWPNNCPANAAIMAESAASNPGGALGVFTPAPAALVGAGNCNGDTCPPTSSSR